MSFIPKLWTALGVVFVFTTAITTPVAGQSPTIDTSTSSAATNTSSASEPKKTASANLSTAVSENNLPEKNSSAIREASDSSTSASDPAHRPAPASAGQWQFQFTPYLWIAGTSGDITIGNRTAHVSSSITDTSVHINFGFMSAFEAHRNKLTILTDLQYSNLGTDNATPGPGFSAVETKTKTFILDPEVGYRFAENKEKARFVELVGGIRYWHLNEELNFTAGVLPAQRAAASRDWVDGVAGLRGRMALNKRWFATGKMDLGGGGAKFTYQLFGGIGVMVAKKVALIGGFRDLYVDRSTGDFTFKMSLHGPIFGLGFKF